MRFLILLGLLTSQSLFAAWTGVYPSTVQQGLAVEMNAQNQYLLYVVQNNQSSPIETGNFSYQDHQISFFPTQSVTGTLTNTVATITHDGCRFTWGQAGKFSNPKPECQASPPIKNIISTFRSQNNLMEIPRLGLPNAHGGADLYKVHFQLLGTNPLRFQMVTAEPIQDKNQAISGIYSPPQQLMYLPMLAVNPESSQGLPVYQLLFKVISFNPFVIAQHSPFQYQYQAPVDYQPPAINRPSQDLSNYYGTMQQGITDMSAVLQNGHQNMMTIINSMGDDGDCNGQYDPSRGCY